MVTSGEMLCLASKNFSGYQDRPFFRRKQNIIHNKYSFLSHFQIHNEEFTNCMK